jgi:hypothetical protein
VQTREIQLVRRRGGQATSDDEVDAPLAQDPLVQGLRIGMEDGKGP